MDNFDYTQKTLDAFGYKIVMFRIFFIALFFFIVSTLKKWPVSSQSPPLLGFDQ